MRYDPTAAKEQTKFQPGTYPFEVQAATEATSKNGNPMMKLVILANVGGFPLSVHDYLVATPGGLWKTKLFAKEVGIDFEAGEIAPENCVGRSGVVVLDYDKKELVEVANGTRERAYLRVVRYGVHDDGKPSAGQSAKSKPSAPPPVKPATPTTDAIGADSDIPF